MDEAEVKSNKKDAEKKNRKRTTVLMESFIESKEKSSPFVGYFPSGFDPINHRDIKGEEENPKVRVFRNEKFPNRLQLVVSPKNSKVDFVGSSHSGEGTAPQVCNYAVGIFDKDKQSLKIVPITANKIFRLDPRVRGEPQELKEETAEEKSTYKLRELTDRYGSKTSQRNFRKFEALYKQSGTAEDKKLTESKVENVEMNMESLETTSSAYAGNIPPHDTTADSPEKAYPLDKIIHDSEWDHLGEIFELIQSGVEATGKFCQENMYPTFVRNRLYKLGQIEDEFEKNKLAGIFSYINYLLIFKKLPNAVQNSTPAFHNAFSHFHGIPVIFFHKFGRLFGGSSSGARSMSNEKHDLLIRYILVLTLFADKFETEVFDIARDLEIEPMVLKSHFRTLGCKTGASVRTKVTLPIPLTFPDLRYMQIRKGKKKK